MKKIDSYKIISTSKGDKGTSKNYSNEEFSKSNILFETLGNMDELSSMLGLTYHYSEHKSEIRKIQLTLQHINSLVATNITSPNYLKLTQISELDIFELEAFEQSLLAESEIEPVFVLPGSDTTIEGAYFDLSRSIARRAERSLVLFVESMERKDLNLCLSYINRLSDLLFIYARSKASKKAQ
ncbi:MAG: ATP:cob(I)alamin adenosyltransferase [Firmicutes bacterium]|nr:ATP:cob(I)alamin adenosyltransferase [Bacillota bacterium]